VAYSNIFTVRDRTTCHVIWIRLSVDNREHQNIFIQTDLKKFNKTLTVYI
jgi:predicted Co/Zn/Cd cation transporter (cation efflux family)